MVIPAANVPKLPVESKKKSSVGRPHMFIINHTYDQYEYFLQFCWTKNSAVPSLSIMTIIDQEEQYMDKNGYFDMGSKKVTFNSISGAISFFDKMMARLEDIEYDTPY